jgi:hypothetical protein
LTLARQSSRGGEAGGYGQGKETNRSAWPKEKEPYLKLLEFLDEVHNSNGCKSCREVARRANLSPNQVNRILRGLVVPSGGNRLKGLVRGLGGGESEINRAVLLLSRCTGARPSVVLKGVSSGWWRSPGYLDRVRDLVPAGGLRKREEELSELAAFCRGNDGYVWWQAGPWAGKSALMATFVLDPPVLVENSATSAELGFHAVCRYSLISPASLVRRWIWAAGPGKAMTSRLSSGARSSMPLPWWLRPVL